MRIFKFKTLSMADPRYCILNAVPEGLADFITDLMQGLPVASVYPRDARAFMEKRNGGMIAPSLIDNTKSLLIVSSPFVSVVKALVPDRIEILPLALFDHKKRPVLAEYSILNPLARLDCLDWDRSEVELLEGDRNQVVHIAKMVFSEAKLADAPHLFRLAQAPTEFFATEDLLAELQPLDLTNLFVDEIEIAQ